MGLAIPYDDYVSKAKPWYEVLRKVAFSPFGLFVLNASYAILGAYMFIWLERPNEEKQKNLKVDKTAEVHDAVAYLKTTFWQYATNEDRFNYTKDEFFEAVSEDLATLKLFVVEYANTYGVDSIDGTVNWDWSWTFPKSLLFTITIMTTIGYGHIFPVTTVGKLVCIIYTLVGCMLFISFLANVSEIMSRGIKRIYSRLCCRWCRVRRRDNELAPDDDRKENSIMLDNVGTETYMPTDEIEVPIMVNLIIMFIFIFGGSLIFMVAEDWRLGSSVYFCFVTLTTIGFGDMWPVKSFVEAAENMSVGGILMLSFTILYCIFGLMLLSLAIGLMGQQIKNRVASVSRALGMGGESSNEEIVKRFKETRINKTPYNMSGNELDFNKRRAGVYRADSDSEMGSDLDADLSDEPALSDITEYDE